MSHYGGRRHAVAGAFIFLLLGVFTVFSTLLVLLGARAYSGIVTRAEKSVRERNLVSYTMSKVRSGAQAGAVRVETWQGVPMLVIAQQIEDDVYETMIYCYKGSLRELFVRVDEDEEYQDDFEPQDGEVLIQADYFTPALDGDMLTIQVGAGDQEFSSGCRLRA